MYSKGFDSIINTSTGSQPTIFKKLDTVLVVKIKRKKLTILDQTVIW